MLDDFKEEQKIAYKILTNAIKNNKLSHAYLFETNGYKNKRQFLLSFAKALLCPYNHTNSKDSVNCHVCENIDKNIYSELKIINPDGMWIKKEQLLDLQDEFKTMGLESNKRVYIINDVERLNSSSANSLLKFLEEPEDNIIALLATDNIHSLLDTIISRCQIITLTKTIDLSDKNLEEKVALYLNENIDVNTLKEMISNTIDFIFYLEQHHLDTLIYTKNLVLNKFDDRNKLEIFFEIMILFYKDILDYKINNKNNIFDIKDIDVIAHNNEIETLQNKINYIMNSKKALKINANTNLLIDKLIIDLEGDVNG